MTSHKYARGSLAYPSNAMTLSGQNARYAYDLLRR